MNTGGSRVGVLRSILSTLAYMAAFSFLWLLGSAVIRGASLSIQQVSADAGAPFVLALHVLYHGTSPLVLACTQRLLHLACK